MNPDYTDRAKMVTSIAVPVWLAQDIKANGMTYSGALVAGWNAIKERQEANQKIANLNMELNDVRKNMQKYREAYMETLKVKE